MPIFIHSQEGGRIRNRKKIRMLVPMIVTFLFVFSALSFSGFVSAGKHYTGPYGTCHFDKVAYSLGETMSISFDGSFGHATKGWFELVLTNPSGQVVMRSQMYSYDAFPTGFTDTVTYTLKTTDQTGPWTAELTYSVAGKRHVTTTAMANAEAMVNP
jgi:hypothetical protein